MAIRDEVIQALSKKSASIFGVNESSLGPDTRFIEDLNAKSVNFVHLSALLENIYEIEVPFMEFRKMKTFRDAGDYIAKMLGE